MKFTEKVMGIVNSTLSAYGPIDQQKAEVEKLYAAGRLTGSVYAEKMQDIRREQDAIRTEALRQIAATKSAYNDAVMHGTELHGSMLHEDAALLTTPGLTLTPHQFTALVEKHLENPAMTQILKDYSNRHEGLYADFIPGPDERLSGFDGFCNAATNCLRDPSTLSAALFQDGKYTPVYCSESEAE